MDIRAFLHAKRFLGPYVMRITDCAFYGNIFHMRHDHQLIHSDKPVDAFLWITCG